MITPEQWVKVVQDKGFFYFWKDDTISAPTTWFATLKYDETLGWICGVGKDTISLDHLYLTELECAQAHIREVKRKYCKEEESK